MAPPPAPGPVPPPVRASDQERASLQRTEQTRTYPCANCGDNLVFDPAGKQLLCPSCGSTAAIVLDPVRRVGIHDLAQASAQQSRGLLDSSDAAAASEREIVCQNCGGRTVFTGTLTARRCPYCATPIQRDDIHEAEQTLPVDGVLPFAVPEQAARSQIEDWIGSRWFAPTEFKKYRELGSFSSVYMSFFSYNTDARTEYQGQRGDDYTVTVGSGDDQRTETRTNWRSVSGVVGNHFTDVPAIGNTGLDGPRIAQLTPWPIETAVPFTGEFIAGHLARTYDYGPDKAFEIARQETIDPAIESTIRSDIGGDHQRISSWHPTFNPLAFRYILMPLWLLTVVFDGRPFQVYINGVTGEVQGQRPYSKVKIAAAVIAAILVVVAIVVAFQLSR